MEKQKKISVNEFLDNKISKLRKELKEVVTSLQTLEQIKELSAKKYTEMSIYSFLKGLKIEDKIYKYCEEKTKEPYTYCYVFNNNVKYSKGIIDNYVFADLEKRSIETYIIVKSFIENSKEEKKQLKFFENDIN